MNFHQNTPHWLYKGISKLSHLASQGMWSFSPLLKTFIDIFARWKIERVPAFQNRLFIQISGIMVMVADSYQKIVA